MERHRDKHKVRREREKERDCMSVTRERELCAFVCVCRRLARNRSGAGHRHLIKRRTGHAPLSRRRILSCGARGGGERRGVRENVVNDTRLQGAHSFLFYLPHSDGRKWAQICSEVVRSEYVETQVACGVGTSYHGAKCCEVRTC
jgi:hypothetical protein